MAVIGAAAPPRAHSQRPFRAAIVALALAAGNAAAEAIALDDCWMSLPGMASRPDVTCEPISENLLMHLWGATEPETRCLMKATGRRIPNGLHFMSNYLGHQGRAGDVNLILEDGRVSVVSAMLDMIDGEAHAPEFIWNSKFGVCSDFPENHKKCSDE